MAPISVDPHKATQNLGALSAGWMYSGASGILVVLLTSVWFGLAMPLTVVVDGVEQQVNTHRRSVGAVLRDLGIETSPVDRVSLPANTVLRGGEHVIVERAQAYRLLVDGRIIDIHSWGERVDEVLADAGYLVDAYDRIYVDSVEVPFDALLLGAPLTQHTSEGAVTTGDNSHENPEKQIEAVDLAGLSQGNGQVRTWPRAGTPRQIQVVRAIPLTIHDGGMSFVVKTTAQTVGEALREAELTIYLGDRVDPGLGSPVSNGLRVQIQRSRPVRVLVGEQELRTRTQAETVAEALADMRIGLSGLDEVAPPLDAALAEGLTIQVTRVHEEVMVEEEIAPFDTVFVPDPNLAIDTQAVNAPGAEGITRTRYRVRFKNGVEASRVHEDTWIAQEPGDRIIAYGQLIEPKTFTTDDGREIRYWRRIQMHASSYSANTAGVSPSSAHYGMTYTGDRMRHGIVAVDPSIVPLRSQVYVPGYGVGDALDTGSAIRSRRIDLGYDDSNLVLWSRWVDVYLLWPPPPSHQITWVIPNWPRPPD